MIKTPGIIQEGIEGNFVPLFTDTSIPCVRRVAEELEDLVNQLWYSEHSVWLAVSHLRRWVSQRELQRFVM
jgi:hypothetical protein